MNIKPLLIVWKKENELGIPIVDEQHRGIVSTINSLFFLVKQHESSAVMKSTLAIMEQYTTIHFQTEEHILESVQWLDLEKHRELHHDLNQRLREVRVDSLEKKSPEILLSFLKAWWLDHINKQDRQYANYITGMKKNHR